MLLIFRISFFLVLTLFFTSALWYPSVSLFIKVEPITGNTYTTYDGINDRDDVQNKPQRSGNASEIRHIGNASEIRHIGNASEIRHIGFLKVRKAGGSTLQNIFFRFGLQRNLTFVLPRNRYYFDISGTLPVKPGGHYDILATHSWYKKEQYDKILPGDKVNIAIVREPIDRLISSAYYYRDVFGMPYMTKIPKSNYIQELILHPEKYEVNHFSETRNSMGQDFGFDASVKITDTNKIVTKLNALEKDFLLVLLTERFEESLVLMKRYLNWNLSDILYISRNTHAHPKVNLTQELREKYMYTSFMDFAIYNHFAKIFDDKVLAEGPEFMQEVYQYQTILNKTTSFCMNGVKQSPYLEIPASAWSDGFRILESDCKIMLKDEITFIDELKARHVWMNGDMKH